MVGVPRRGKRRGRVRRGPAFAGLVALAALAPGCRPASTICPLDAHCAAPASSATPLSQTRRLLYEPVDVAYVRRHGDGDGTPALATLGSGDGALLLLRFSIDLPPEPGIVEAFVLLERAADVDADPGDVILRAARVTQPWDSRSVSWALRPRVELVDGPPTAVRSGTQSLVRLGVLDLARRWLRRGRDEFGIAVQADGPGSAGVTFALAAGGGSVQSDGDVAERGPRLELYVK